MQSGATRMILKASASVCRARETLAAAGGSINTIWMLIAGYPVGTPVAWVTRRPLRLQPARAGPGPRGNGHAGPARFFTTTHRSRTPNHGAHPPARGGDREFPRAFG